MDGCRMMIPQTGASLATYQTGIADSWIDYNGHVTDSAYPAIIAAANELLFEEMDLSSGYRHRTGCTFYTVEVHIYYHAEVLAGDLLRAVTTITEATDKRIRMSTSLLRRDDVVAARAEHVYVHVDQSIGRVVPFTPQ